MGERKGQNKYYPPDYDPKVGGLNKFQGVHALRERGRKAHLGIIIIRFEMPYNIWCDGCNNHIGMGVRYNAEKKKTGMYYTTPVYEFNMKCHLCDNHFIIKTDPGNLDYQIISGARRQENRWDPLQNEQIVPETKETQKKLFDDSMYKLEHGKGDTSIAESSKPRLVKLYNRNEDTWADNFTANQKLRAAFRSKSKEMKMKAAVDNALLKKSSLNIALLPESEDDKRVASLLRIKPTMDVEKKTELLRKQIISSSALPMDSFTPDKERKAVKAMKTTLATNLVVKKHESTNLSHVSKKSKMTNSLVGDYGESSSSDSN